ncbi:MAG: hypothetical protein JW726_15720 [Anaerolineales bacterium]|nr:hypothetical protein [Anaerolineales bacterium]
MRLSHPQGVMAEGTVWGWMQFIDEQTPARIYTITEGEVPLIDVPYPPNENQPANLPLRLALARLVAGVMTGEVVPDEWVVVTSLVRREELGQVFTTNLDVLFWRLDSLEIPLRQVPWWL